MDPPLASVKTTDILTDSNLFNGEHKHNWGSEPTELNWNTLAENNDAVSDLSGSFDDIEFELPKDMPDGPQFTDLAAHIDSVVDSLVHKKPSAGTSVTVNGVLGSQSPINLEETVENDVSQPAASSCTFSSQPDLDIVDDSNNEARELPEHGNFESEEPHTADSTPNKPCVSADPLNVRTEGLTDERFEANDVPLFSDDIKPFAFFPTGDASEVESDQWAFPEGGQTTHPASVGNEDILQKIEEHLSDVELESDEDFGDFEGCQVTSVPENTHTNQQEMSKMCDLESVENSSILGRLLQHLEPTLAKAFENPIPQALGDWMVENTLGTHVENSRHMNSSEVPPDSLTAITEEGTTFWSKLFIQGRAHDVRQQWNKSLLYDSYLRSVNIDIRSAMPAFASQLRLLEPIRLGSSNTPTEHVANPEKSKTQISVTLNPAVTADAPEDQEHTAPEFDWTSSGLTNPLSANSTTEPQLDLDFFEVQSDAKANNERVQKNPKISELEQELFATIPQPPPPLKNPPTAQAVLSPTELLSHSSAPAPAEPKPSSTFSSTVRAVVARLPKLGYMRARTLILPIPETESG